MTSLYLGNDHRVTLTGVTVNGSPATTGTGAWQVLDADGETVADGAMTNDGAGNLSGTLEAADIATEDADTYGSIWWTFQQGAFDAEWTDDVQFLKRGV